MAAPRVGEDLSGKTLRCLTDISSQELSLSSGKDRREESLPPSVQLPPQHMSHCPTTSVYTTTTTSGEEQTSSLSSLGSLKQNVTVLAEQTTNPGKHRLADRQEVDNYSRDQNLDRRHPIAFHGSGIVSRATFALPSVRYGQSQPRSPSTMVAVTAPAPHRPVLYKSHSVAYGVDSTLSPSPAPPPLSDVTMMSTGSAQLPPTSGSQDRVSGAMSAPMIQRPLSSTSPSSSSSPSLSSSTDGRSSQPPRPLGVSRLVAGNSGGNLGHQDSLGFSVPEPWKQPLRRSESLRIDSLPSGGDSPLSSSLETVACSGAPTTPSPERGRRHGQAGGSQGKWRSPSCTRRSASRNQPLSRSNSRNALMPPLRSAQQGPDPVHSVPRTPSSPLVGTSDAQHVVRRTESSGIDQLARKTVLPGDVLEGPGVVAPDVLPDVFRDDAENTNIHSQQLAHPKEGVLPNVLRAAEKMHFDVLPGDSGVRSNTDEDLLSGVFADSVFEGGDERGTAPQTPASATHSSPSLHRRSSRRRSYQQATGEPSTPKSAGVVDDDEKSDAEGSEGRGVKVEDVKEEDEEESGSSLTPPVSPRPAKNRRIDMSSYDPYHVFEVQHLPSIIFTVKVIQGRNITNGILQDLVDTPDPYIKLRLKTAPEGRRRSKTIANNVNPVWNETFTFFLGFSENNVLEVTLMEENPLVDQEKGTIYFNIHDRIREFGKWQTEIFNFNGVSEVDVAFHMEWDQNPTLRYSLCLSDQEKEFMRKRKERVFQALKTLLGDLGPRTLDETPTIAVIGSGGGFRAMTGYSGVFKALANAGLLDCATYACGLSGSSWYLSTLYSHERWPEMNPGEMQTELMNNIDKSLVRLLGPQSIYRYVRSVVSKRRQGQPVSFTDFFGHMVGETLLKGRLDSRLTDQREKIEGATVPMPLYTCVHVKKDVPARSFQEWVEFSPYEIGMPKYGTFMDSKYFGSKFYMGKLVKAYDEPPLHFLQGIWGSAFCILFKRLLEDNRNLDPAEMIRREMEMRDDLGEHLEERQDDDNDSSDISDDDEEDGDETDDTDEEMVNGARRASTTTATPTTPTPTPSLVPESFRKADSPITDSSDRDTSDGESSESDLRPPPSFLTRQDSSEGFDDVDSRPEPRPLTSMETSTSTSSPTSSSMPRPIRRTSSPGRGDKAGGPPGSPDGPKKGVRFSRQVDQLEKRKAQHRRNERAPLLKRASTIRRGKSRSYWSSILKGIFESQSCELLSTRAGRAAVIHNFMRGLNLQQTYPLSPFTPLSQRVQEGDEFDGIFELHPTHIKHIYMVDAGLTFNSPFPLVLRPQRGVDVILSFDFSARDSDRTPPFKELLLAEKWAKINRLPFPPIDTSVVDREGLKELYVFQDPDNPHCPVVLHFPLVNIHFRSFKAPGVPRETQEEKDFAHFDIFDDHTAPFSTFNFTYTARNFQRLSKLTEFNTLLGVERVKAVLAEAVARKRESRSRAPIHMRDFKLLRMKSVQERRELRKFLTRMESRGNVVKTPTPPSSQSSTPFFTPTPTPNKTDREKNPFNFSFTPSQSSSSSDSSQEGRNPFFSTSSRHPSQTRSPNRSPRSPRTHVSARGVQDSGKREPERGRGRLASDGSEEEFSSLSPVPLSPSSLPTDSFDDVFHRSPSTPTTTTTTNHNHRPSHQHQHHHRPPHLHRSDLVNEQQSSSSSSQIGKVRQRSPTTLGPLRQSSELSHSGGSDDEFHDAPAAFTRDGEAVMDPQRAKMYYEGAKQRRKLLRRQSTISTLNSFTESISLDSQDPVSRFTSRGQASCGSGAPISMDVADLGQFEGIVEDGDQNVNGDNNHDDGVQIDDAVEEHWYDGDSGSNSHHRGSVITLGEQEGS